MKFRVGDRVTWTRCDDDIPRGDVGEVMRLPMMASDEGKYTVKFLRGAWKFDEGALLPAHLRLGITLRGAPADSSAWEPAGDEESDSWGARGWLASLETAPDLAAALLGGAKPADEFSAMRALGVKLETEEALVALLERGGALPMLAKRLLPELRQLAAGAAAGAPQESKFAGAIELSYSGLDQFYNGLEGQIGAPRPNVLEAMEADHLRGCDCDDEFTTGNYGVTSTSRVEWHFVADPAGGLEHLGREEWPAESEEMLPNREHCRRAEPLEDFLSQMEGKNARLRAAEQPELIKPEVLGGRLYTGCAPATSH